MNVQKLKEAMEKLKGEMGKGLLTSDIMMQKDGQALVSYNPDPKLCALATLMIKQIKDIVNKVENVKLGQKLVLRLEEDKTIVILFYGEYLWAMMVDKKEIQIGLVLNAIIPEAIKNLGDAVNS